MDYSCRTDCPQRAECRMSRAGEHAHDLHVEQSFEEFFNICPNWTVFGTAAYVSSGLGCMFPDGQCGPTVFCGTSV